MTEQEWEVKYKHLQQCQVGETRRVQVLSDKNRDLEARLKKLAMFESQEQAIKDRLQAVEQAYTSKVAALELTHYAQRKAWETGVSYELLENYGFESTKQIDQHIGKLSAFIEERKQADLNTRLMSVSKPQAGGEPGATRHTTGALEKITAKAIGQHLGDDY